MQRRGFLGLLAGSVAVAPVAAKNALTTAAPLSGSAYAGMVTSLDDLATNVGYAASPDPDWRADRIIRLKKLISGDDQEDDTDIRPRLRMVEHHINSLGSISPASKVRLFRNAVKLAQAEQRKRSWLEELLQLENEKDF